MLLVLFKIHTREATEETCNRNIYYNDFTQIRLKINSVTNQGSEVSYTKAGPHPFSGSRQDQNLGNKQLLQQLVWLLGSTLWFVTHIWKTEMLLKLGLEIYNNHSCYSVGYSTHTQILYFSIFIPSISCRDQCVLKYQSWSLFNGGQLRAKTWVQTNHLSVEKLYEKNVTAIS